MIPFIVCVKRAEETRMYVLQKNEVKIPPGYKGEAIRYSLEEVPNDPALPTVTVQEEAIYGLSVDTMVKIARSAVQDAGFGHPEAATLVSGLAGQISRLSHTRRDELTAILCAILDAN